MVYKQPNVGDKVRVTVEGYVFGPATNGISVMPVPADGTGIPQRVQMYWDTDYPAGSTPTVEILEAAYVPQPGDVALWSSTSGEFSPLLVTYCQVSPSYKGWYTGGHGTLIATEVDYLSERFKLVARDGQTVSYTPNAAPKSKATPAPERQAVLDDYKPKRGDVGTYLSASGSLITVVYRRKDDEPFGDFDWYQTNGFWSTDVHKDPSFQLILRDGVLQEGINV